MALTLAPLDTEQAQEGGECVCRGVGRVSGKESEVCQLVSVRSVFPVKENSGATDSLWIG